MRSSPACSRKKREIWGLGTNRKILFLFYFISTGDLSITNLLLTKLSVTAAH